MKRTLTIAQVVWAATLRRKDVYVLFILAAGILLATLSLNVFGLGGATRYVKDVGLLACWVFAWILAVHVGCRELPEEESRGTILPLLAKPVTRADVVLGKWLGSWSVATAAALVFYAVVCLVVLARGGHFTPLALGQGFILHACVLAILTAGGEALSTRLNRDAAASLTLVLSGAAFLFAPRIPQMMAHEGGVRGVLLLALYHLVPHFELFDMRTRLVHDYGPVSWTVFGMVIAYGLLWLALLLTLAWASYRNRHFTRERV